MATTYNVIVRTNYYRAYIKSARSTKFEFVETSGQFTVKVASVTAQEAPVAFRMSEGREELRWYGGKLWRMHTYKDYSSDTTVTGCGPELLGSLLRPELPYGPARDRATCARRYRKEAERFLLIDGVIWKRTGEPRYVVNTFGLGHNHGGTGLFVESFYNPNISSRNYFSALDGDAAVAYANKVAQGRGDTNDVGTFRKMIDVLIPEAVTIRPKEEHGDGDPFINKINSITAAAPDVTTAGLLAMMVTAGELSR